MTQGKKSWMNFKFSWILPEYNYEYIVKIRPSLNVTFTVQYHNVQFKL